MIIMKLLETISALDLFSLILSFIGFVFALRIEDNLLRASLIFGGLLIWVVLFFGSVIKKIKEDNKTLKLEIQKINERLKIYRTLSNHEARIKRIEESK